MSDEAKPQLDVEVMSALIEGRLNGEERDRALAVVAASKADYEWFVQASATFQAFVGEADGEVVRAPSRNAKDSWYRRRALLLATAAGLVALVSIPLIRARVDEAAIGGPLARAEALGRALGPLTVQFGEDWLGSAGGETRGEDEPSPRRLAIGLGVGLSDFVVARGANDSAGKVEAARRVLRLARSAPGGGPAAQLFEASLRGGSERERRAAIAGIAGLSRRQSDLEAAAWMETARLAALRERTEAITMLSAFERSIWKLDGGGLVQRIRRFAPSRTAADSLQLLIDSLAASP